MLLGLCQFKPKPIQMNVAIDATRLLEMVEGDDIDDASYGEEVAEQPGNYTQPAWHALDPSTRHFHFFVVLKPHFSYLFGDTDRFLLLRTLRTVAYEILVK